MNSTNPSRRSFIRSSLGAIASSISGLGIAQNLSKYNATLLPTKTFIPPLFCTAYVTPNAPGQAGQEKIVARYPLANVPQDNSPIFRQWRDKVKTLNPNIMLLGYQVVIQETVVPGPGHERLNKVKNSFCVYPGGMTPTVPGAFPGNFSRIYDPRTPEWRTGFLEACNATLASYPYSGLFLDQCTIFGRAHPFPWVRAEMLSALQDALTELRKMHPNVILVGNSSYNFSGLNGEMNEGRPGDITKEMSVFSGHIQPRIEMVQTMLKHANDVETVRREMALAHAVGAFYGACVEGTHVLWFDIFDEVLAAYSKVR